MHLNVYAVIMVLFGIAYAGVRYSAGPELRQIVDGRFAASFALITLAGFFLPSSLTFFFVCFLVIIVGVRDPMDALCRYVLLIALTPHMVGFLHVGSIFLFQAYVTTALSAGCLVAIAIRSDTRPGAPLRGFTAEDAVVLLFFLALSIGGSRFESMTGQIRDMFAKGTVMVLPYYLFRRNVRNVAEMRAIIGAVAVAALVLSVFALYEASMGWTIFGTIKARLNQGDYISLNRMTRGGTLRASVTMTGALSLACYLAIGWVATACSRSLLRSTVMWVGWMGIVSVGLLAAQSRGNSAALAVGAVLLLALRGRGVAAAALAGGAAMSAALLFALASRSEMIAGFVSVNASEQGEPYDYRQVLLRRGLEVGAQHRWTGAELQSVLAKMADVQQGQGIVDLVNTYLTIYLVSGLLGFVPLVVLLVRIIGKLLRRMRRNTSHDLVAARAFALIAVCVLLFQLSFMSFIDRIPFMLGLVMASARVVDLQWRRERRNPVEPAATGNLTLPPRVTSRRLAATPRKAPQGG